MRGGGLGATTAPPARPAQPLQESSMECLVTRKSPDWDGIAVHPSFKSDNSPDGFKNVSLADFKGKWLYLFFYPFDFTFVCPTELLAMSEHHEAFKKMNTEVL